MANYIDSIYTALNNLTKIVADYIQAEDIIVATLTVTDRIYFPTVFTWNNLINQLPTLLGTNQLVKTNFTGNITQSSGTNHLLDTEIGSITQDRTIG
jgi:nicotinamide mononucleotide adenylyltransferase